MSIDLMQLCLVEKTVQFAQNGNLAGNLQLTLASVINRQIIE